MASSSFSALAQSLDSTLWVVTSCANGRNGGLVATFVMPASIVETLPRVLVGIGKPHKTWELIEASGAFALHLLGEEHLDLALRFGLESGRDCDKFAGLSFKTGPSGSPILRDALAWADCRVEARMDTGDRTVYLAEVVDCQPPTGTPLTVQKWFPRLSASQRDLLAVQRSRDEDVDRQAILQWRAGRTTSSSRE
jgi:flavin reductase (DIM6/NTAB) family NADH-FMN oxidoreductase RutF